jgi:hypothetical protein
MWPQAVRLTGEGIRGVFEKAVVPGMVPTGREGYWEGSSTVTKMRPRAFHLFMLAFLGAALFEMSQWSSHIHSALGGGEAEEVGSGGVDNAVAAKAARRALEQGAAACPLYGFHTYSVVVDAVSANPYLNVNFSVAVTVRQCGVRVGVGGGGGRANMAMVGGLCWKLCVANPVWLCPTHWSTDASGHCCASPRVLPGVF